MKKKTLIASKNFEIRFTRFDLLDHFYSKNFSKWKIQISRFSFSCDEKFHKGDNARENNTEEKYIEKTGHTGQTEFTESFIIGTL